MEEEKFKDSGVLTDEGIPSSDDESSQGPTEYDVAAEKPSKW